MTEERMAMMRIDSLAARASRLGYQLIRVSAFPERWTLLDAEDFEPIREDLLLTDIEHWLNE